MTNLKVIQAEVTSFNVALFNCFLANLAVLCYALNCVTTVFPLCVGVIGVLMWWLSYSGTKILKERTPLLRTEGEHELREHVPSEVV